jgi:type IV fimbrial biogenesis protein FimT
VVYYTAGMIPMTTKCIPPRIPGAAASGFTLMESLIAMAILGILLTVAMPGFSTYSANQRLIGAAEQVYNHLQQARTESIGRGQTVYMNFSTDGTTTWTYGMSNVTSSCDLTKTAATDTGACRMVVSDGDASLDTGDGATDTGDLVLYRFASTDYSGVSMSIANFSSGTSQIVYNSLRGTSTSGRINLVGANGKQLRVGVNLLGRVKLCSPDGSTGGYGTC